VTGLVEPERERPVTSTADLTEAFSLGSNLAEIKTTLGFVRQTVEKTDGTVTDMSSRLGAVEVEQGKQGEQIRTAFQRIEAVEQRPAATAPDAVTRAEFEEVRNEVKSGRLSWPKLLTGAGGIVATLAIIAWFDGLTPGT